MSVNSKMTALADEIRVLSGTTEAIGLDAMKAHVGEANEEVDSQANLIAQIITALDGKASDGGEAAEITLQSKTVTPATSVQVVTADSGYDGLDKVTVNAMPTATQATPSITVDVNGEITASATQTAGYVVAGTKSATKQLTTQAAATITPTTTNQTIAAGTYLTGVQTIKGDSNLKAENIKSGISIFGISGTLAGGASESYENAILTGTITSYTNNAIGSLRNAAFMYATELSAVNLPTCSEIGQSAFLGCTKLATASFEKCTVIRSNAFQNCTKLSSISFPVCVSIYWAGFSTCASLTTADLPECTYLGGRAFQGCTKLASLSLPKCEYIFSSTFQSCKSLATINLPAITMIGSTAFGSCTNLKTFYLPGSTLCELSGSNAFTGTGITSAAGSIYVNASLVDSYKAATNWAYFSNVIYPIE